MELPAPVSTRGVSRTLYARHTKMYGWCLVFHMEAIDVACKNCRMQNHYVRLLMRYWRSVTGYPKHALAEP